MPVFRLFWIFFRLGLVSFGGPVAHLGYFQQAFVDKKKWLSAEEYAELVALCQFLPGPASSQVGMAIGHKMAGQAGCFAAWLGFTLPSALLMALLAIGIYSFDSGFINPLIQGFLIVAISVVAHAVWGMYSKLCTRALTRSIALVSTLILVFIAMPFLHVVTIALAGLITVFLVKRNSVVTTTNYRTSANTSGIVWFVAFAGLLALLPIVGLYTNNPLLDIFDVNYRAGALVFGGGHVVLPLLEHDVVAAGWMDENTFLTGYGLAQALPGPLFTFATYIGGIMGGENAAAGAFVATIAIFLPGYLLLMAALPFIKTVQQHPVLSNSLVGINAAVVGILLAAFIDPVLTKGINSVMDVIIAIIGFYLLNNLKRPILEVMAVIMSLSLLTTWLI